MSGGPILSETGNVIGVICSSFGEHEDGGHISYASLIGPALLIQVEAKLPSGKDEQVFLYDFVLGGSVVLDDTAQSLTFKRTGATLTIDFGVEPSISNVLKGSTPTD